MTVTQTEYDRPCPLCGAETEIIQKRRDNWRTCTECNWEITKKGPSSKSDQAELRERVEQLEREVERLADIVRESDDDRDDDLVTDGGIDMSSSGTEQKCQWSDPGETCDNEATQVVQIRIGGSLFQFPSCDECATEESQ